MAGAGGHNEDPVAAWASSPGGAPGSAFYGTRPACGNHWRETPGISPNPVWATRGEYLYVYEVRP